MNTRKENTDKSSKLPDIDLSNAEFQSAWKLLESTNRSVFLTGKAGTGKSTFLRYITSATDKKYVVLAPTGIAAVNVGGQTMHSFFKIPLKPLLPDDPDFAVSRLRQRLKYSSSHIKLIRSLDLIIIDEISMVRADVIDFVDRVLRVYTGNMRLPFGGKQMLFVGDVFQLEPVVTGNDRDVLSHAYTSYYFFNARVFRQMDIVPVELTKVYRQEEQAFVNILDRVRMGRPDSNDMLVLNSRYNPETTDEGRDFVMTIATRRDMVDAINEKHLMELSTPSVTFEGIIERDFPENALPTDKNLELKVGAQVVFVKNDPERRWVNGTLAVVETCAPDELTVRTEDGEVLDVEIEKWANVKYIYNEKTRKVDEIELGSFTQYPLKLAWALTIHKSQGLTFNKVIIDIGRGAFAGGQTYVALSRCRALDGITLVNPIANRDIYVKPEIAAFAARFNSEQLITDAMQSSMADSLYAAAALAFNRGNLTQAFNHFSEAVSLRPQQITEPNVQRLINIKLATLTSLQTRIAQLQQQIDSDRNKFEEIAAEYTTLADELTGDGWETESAMKQYDRALHIAPHYPPATLGKARLAARQNQFELAETLYADYASGNMPDAWQGYLGIGDIRMALGDDFGAIDRYLAANLAYPETPEPLQRLINAYTKINDPETADLYKRQLRQLKSRATRGKRKN